jgi:hypothetical protein
MRFHMKEHLLELLSHPVMWASCVEGASGLVRYSTKMFTWGRNLSVIKTMLGKCITQFYFLFILYCVDTFAESLRHGGCDHSRLFCTLVPHIGNCYFAYVPCFVVQHAQMMLACFLLAFCILQW